MTMYLKVAANAAGVTDLRVDVDYYKGDYRRPRGYYVTATPVKREEKDGYTLESFTAYTGGKMLLFTVQRKSVKAERQRQADRRGIDYLTALVLKNNGLKAEKWEGRPWNI